MAIFLSPARRRLRENAPLYYPFGGKLPRSALQEYKGSEKAIKVLFLGCLDLKNVLHTIMSKPDKEDSVLNIHLNHSCPFLLARNILILKIVSAANFSISSPEDVNYLWDVWYNFEWSQKTRERFTADVNSLVGSGLPVEHCSALNKSQLDELQEIYKGWLLSVEERLSEASQIKKKVLERKVFVKNGGFGEFGGKMARAAGVFEDNSYENLADWRELAMGMDDFPELLKKKISKETKLYFETGSCSPSKLNSVAALNPTLLEPKTLRWRVDVATCPFDSFSPLPLNELEKTASEGIATRYCQKVLKNLVAAYRKQKKNVHFHFHSSEDMQFCINTAEKFDVIDCSTLADDVGLANMLASAIKTLELHPDALLLTESHHWGTVGSTIALYIEESLCSPLSMIPTIYGLRLGTHVELGTTTLMERDCPAGYPPVTLLWRPAPRFENLPLCSSPSLKMCLRKLGNKCHFMEEWYSRKSKENCGVKNYTPFTWNLVSARLAEYSGSLFQSEFPPRFSLAIKTLEDWTNHRPVTLLTASQPFTPVLQNYYNQNQMMFLTPLLRIVLTPANRYLDVESNIQRSLLGRINWATETPFTHYIDNFDLHYQLKEDGTFRSVQVSFLLPQDHGLEKTHCMALIDLESGTPMMFMGAIKDMKQQVYDYPHPIAKRFPLPSEIIQQGPHMQVVSCEESETEFNVQIQVLATNELEGLKISTDQQLPCESAHRVSFSFAKPEGMQSLNMNFPYPVLVDGIKATVSRSERSVRVVLTKAIYEPWPCHFTGQSKCEVEKFVPWREPCRRDDVTQLGIHVAGQKSASSIGDCWKSVLDPKKSNRLPPLEEIRLVVSLAFTHAEMGIEYFTVYSMSDSKKPIWDLRVHFPILTSPSGCPVLLISAVDHRFSEKLVSNGKLQKEKFAQDLKRIVGLRRGDKPRLPIILQSEETIPLLRYVLRLNSTKMVPSSWQKANLLPDEYTPFLATFFSPLYLDSQYPIEDEIGEFVEKLVDKGRESSGSFEDLLPSFNPNRCTCCGKKSAKLKRCSKCKLAFYCTVDCQRADWKRHKIGCALFNC